jgi:hypothetical protein
MKFEGPPHGWKKPGIQRPANTHSVAGGKVPSNYILECFT